MKKVNLKNAVWKENKNYVSLNLNTGISSFGDTKEEALFCLKEALELYFEDAKHSETIKVDQADIVSLEFEYA